MKEEMLAMNVAQSIASLGHEARLALYRLLVRARPSGMTVGQVVEELDMPASTLAHHLRMLVQSGLVIQERNGREVINRPDFEAMSRITPYLQVECCSGVQRQTDAA
jgi:ArsR family transcriptional regulator, arsenate/arsenite/antimonite-responsive transcriptional repressor